MNMPDIVKAYFDADRGHGPDALAELFATDAVVGDDGDRHEGIDAILAWWTAAKAKYNHVAEPLEATCAGETVVVHATVTGQFPSSPTVLEYTFAIKDDKIVALRIHQ